MHLQSTPPESFIFHVNSCCQHVSILIWRVQGYLAHKEHPPPTVGLYLGSYGVPRGGGLFLMSEVPLWRQHSAGGRGRLLPGRSTAFGVLGNPTQGQILCQSPTDATSGS